MTREEFITDLILLGLFSGSRLIKHGYSLRYYHPLGGVEIYAFENTASVLLPYSHTTSLSFNTAIKQITEHLTEIKGEDNAIVPRPK